LIDEGHEVHVIDDLSAVSNEKFYFNENAINHKIDIRDKKKIDPLFEGVDYVFHLAAESRLQTAITNPTYAYSVNVLGMLNILESCKKHKVKRLLYSSTSSVYGLTNNFPTSENNELSLLNPYSLSKFFGEQMCENYSNDYNLDIIIFRYFNVFGERSPVKGQYAPVIGIFLNQKDTGKKFTVVGDGEQKRDFVHVSDIAKANILGMKSTKTFKSDIFNVGSGINYSINEITNFIGGESVNIPNRPGEAKNTLSDITKIKTMLGFNPTIDLKEWIKTKK
jgi:UDP-glucose 4-epimerase